MKTLLVIVTCLGLALQLGEPAGLHAAPDRSGKSIQQEMKTAGQSLQSRVLSGARQAALDAQMPAQDQEAAQREKPAAPGRKEQSRSALPQKTRDEDRKKPQDCDLPDQSALPLSLQDLPLEGKGASSAAAPASDGAAPAAGTESQAQPSAEKAPDQAAPVWSYTQADLDLLARLIYCEMGCSWIPDEQQRKVGSVVLNRMASELYPDTLQEVIYQPGQYSPAASGWLESVTADDKARQNAQWLLENGSILPGGVLGQSTVALGTVHSSYYDAVLGTTTYYFYLD